MNYSLSSRILESIGLYPVKPDPDRHDLLIWEDGGKSKRILAYLEQHIIAFDAIDLSGRTQPLKNAPYPASDNELENHLRSLGWLE